ncbi:MAG TPA: hypothetical protein VII47_09945 [Actinomycetota bacterium]
MTQFAFRTVRFHQASVLEAVLDLVEDGEGGDMTVEWGPRLADYERYDREGTLRGLVRAKPGAESDVVSSDLWMAMRRWSVVDAAEPVFVYHSEAPLCPTAVAIVAEKLERFAAGVATEEDRRLVRMIGIPPESRCLRHVALRARSGPVDLMTTGVLWRVQRLLEPLDPGGDVVGGVVDRLLAWCWADQGTVRVLTRGEACEILGVRSDRLLDGPEWDAGDLEMYRSALLARNDPPVGDRPPAVVAASQPGSPAAEPVTDLLNHPPGAAILGPAGPVMTAALDALRRAAAGAGASPFVVEVRNYRYRSLVTSVRMGLESITGRRVGAAAARRFLMLPGLVLLLDGALASQDAEAALVDDLRAIQARNGSLQVVALGMGSRQARLLGLPLFRLQALHPSCP